MRCYSHHHYVDCPRSSHLNELGLRSEALLKDLLYGSLGRKQG